ncbi:glutamyl-tRNA reductase [Fimbriimonas ginsengisoli Gsoil 348]|uniref:Glutamyl-tRNA reductase n=2 Tax=Fimbriimonas ginsengisoli TaxID=1005039 RepID=A0A068NL43_FIMGI|nr:glutamyl-tRNA reductase [Fimbriimonas ginsengisoli Gsoil 348]
MPAPFGVVGLSHRTAPLEVRSRVTIPPDAIPDFLALAKANDVPECVVLSTCNRTEIYYSGTEAEVVRTLLAGYAEVPLEELRPFLYEKGCVCAACHLFRVTSGLDSAVLGETEIVAQIKEAWRSGTTGPVLDLLFQRGLETSKRIRTETELCRNVTSTGSLAVREAEHRIGSLKDRRSLVLGAGKIAERVVRELRSRESCDVRIVNRTFSKADLLADKPGFEAVPFDFLHAELLEADVVFATVAATAPILSRELIGQLSEARQGRPLVVIDLGVPPNVENGSLAIGIDVVNLDEITAGCAENSERRMAAIPFALEILEEELGRFGAALTERAAAPTIRALIARGEAIRSRNVEWAKERLEGLTEREIRVVEEMARRMMIGLLEAPIDSLKGELAGHEHRAVVERLFLLDGGPSDR